MTFPQLQGWDDPEKLAEGRAAAQTVRDNYHRSKHRLVDRKRDSWKEWLLGYRMVIDKKADASRTQIADETIFVNVEDFLPRLVASGPKVEVWPATNDPDDVTRAGQNRAVIEYDWRKLGLVFRTFELVKSAQVFGTAFFKVTWKKRFETRGRRQFTQTVTPFGGTTIRTPGKIVAKKEPTWDDPWVELCAIDEVFPDPDAVDVEDAAWFIHRVKTDLQSVRSAMLNGEKLYDERVVAMLEQMARDRVNPLSNADSEQSLFDMRDERFNQADTGSSDPDHHKFEFHLLEQWSPSKVTTIIEELQDLNLPPLRHEWNELGEIPFVKYTPIPDIRGMYGISMAEILFAHSVERGSMRAARLDAVAYAVHQMYLIRRGSGVNPKQVRFRSGGHIMINEPGDISVIDRGNMPTALYREIESIDRSIERIGATATFQGLAAEGGQTATEARILEAASGSRAALMFIVLGIQTMTPLGKLIMRVNELYLTGSRFHRITGNEYLNTQFPGPQRLAPPGEAAEQPGQEGAPRQEFIEITPDGLNRGSGLEMDVKVDISAVEPGGRMARLTQARNALQDLTSIVLPQHPFMKATMVKYGEGIGIENPEEKLNNYEAQVANAAKLAAENPNANPEATPNASTPAEEISSDLGTSEGGRP